MRSLAVAALCAWPLAAASLAYLAAAWLRYTRPLAYWETVLFWLDKLADHAALWYSQAQEQRDRWLRDGRMD